MLQKPLQLGGDTELLDRNEPRGCGALNNQEISADNKFASTLQNANVGAVQEMDSIDSILHLTWDKMGQSGVWFAPVCSSKERPDNRSPAHHHTITIVHILC